MGEILGSEIREDFFFHIFHSSSHLAFATCITYLAMTYVNIMNEPVIEFGHLSTDVNDCDILLDFITRRDPTDAGVHV